MYLGLLVGLSVGRSVHPKYQKQAWAELGQAQVKLEVVDEGLAKAELKLQL